MVLISASTVFVKQHSILDVFAGIILALAIYLCIYKVPPIFIQLHRLSEEENNV
jgi:membrane-associated phospholipid phosphatase